MSFEETLAEVELIFQSVEVDETDQLFEELQAYIDFKTFTLSSIHRPGDPHHQVVVYWKRKPRPKVVFMGTFGDVLCRLWMLMVMRDISGGG